MRFRADMGVDQRIVDWLRTQGHDAVHLRDQGLHRAADVDIFAKAIAEDSVVQFVAVSRTMDCRVLSTINPPISEPMPWD